MTSHLLQVVQQHRSAMNETFYSTREIASFFGVSQNTAAWAVRRLEKEGFLRRVRGSQTLVLGKEVIARSQIRAVAGLLMWVFAQRFSEVHTNLNLLLAEKLWPHNIALESIPHHDLGDTRPDLDGRLKIHSIDFAIWPFPFPHHREHIHRLEDRGIRNLIIDVNGIAPVLPPQVIIDIVTPYTEILHFWREQGIRKVIVVEPREFPPRKRLKLFTRIALEMGFECKVESNSYSLPRELLKREKERVGIALLDEHSTAEFTLYNPSAFLRLLRRHRILFGNGYFYNTPFVPDGELRVDRIFIPNPDNPLVKQYLITAITQTLVNWTAGDFSQPPITVPALAWADGKLWRFL